MTGEPVAHVDLIHRMDKAVSSPTRGAALKCLGHVKVHTFVAKGNQAVEIAAKRVAEYKAANTGISWIHFQGGLRCTHVRRRMRCRRSAREPLRSNSWHSSADKVSQQFTVYCSKSKQQSSGCSDCNTSLDLFTIHSHRPVWSG